MKFAHLADLHVGSWRHPLLNYLSHKAFTTAIDECIDESVDFILFAGDIFNTSLPAVDILKIVVKKLKELKDRRIQLYVIPGSHDFSPSGKSIIDVLEKAGLLINVNKGGIVNDMLQLKFTIDSRTGAKITGMLGKRGMLDKKYYMSLDRESLENEEGYKIFLFHNSIDELKPKHLSKIESQPLSMLPKGFDYYAGGHLHHPVVIHKRDYENVVYTGALFPVNFAELEMYKEGYYNIIKDGSIVQKKISLARVESVSIKFSDISPSSVSKMVSEKIDGLDLKGKILTLRIKGNLSAGSVNDIDIPGIVDEAYSRGASLVLKNISVSGKEFEEIKIGMARKEDIEESLIDEHIGQKILIDKEKDKDLIKMLMAALNTSKKDGERVIDFERRIIEESVSLTSKP